MVEQKRLGEAVEDYLRFRAGKCAAATVKNDGFVLRRFVAWYGDVQVRHMRPDRVADWFYGDRGLMHVHTTRDRVHREPIQAATHNYYRSRLVSLFRFCTQRGWLRDDLLRDVEPKKDVVKRRLQPPPEMLLALLDAAENDRDRAYIATIINTAFRAQTVSAVRVHDVDFKAGSLRVFISKTQEEDLFPMTSDLAGELRSWLRTYALDLGRPLNGDDYLFPARTGSVYRWRTGRNGTKERFRTEPTWRPDRPVAHTERIVQTAMRGLGLPTKHEGTHTVRRAVARAFFDSMSSDVGYDAALRTTSAMLHHKSSATTEHYLGLSSERQRRDHRLRGQPFLSAMVNNAEVLSLREHRKS